MGIFRRGNKDIDNKPERDPVMPAADAGSDESAQPDTGLASYGRSRGPFDRSEVDGLADRLDLGALWLTGTPGMELRVEVGEDSDNPLGVTAMLGESQVQLLAFAAPRSEGIWDDIRTEIAASITSQGGTADKTSGPLGAELQARMPSKGPDGSTVFSPVRFVGVDGPRWFLRAVITGRAAIDEDAASPLLDVVRATVVVRGNEAMAPREMLALKLPDVPNPAGTDDTEDSAGSDHPDGADHEATKEAPSLSDLKPFERGPEITEIH